MMHRIRPWWAALSLRERILIAVMIGLLGATLIVFGIALPVDRALREARQQADAAIELNASIRSKVAMLRRLPRAVPARPVIAEAIAQTAAEAGVTVDRTQPQGNGRVEASVGAAPPFALFRWIGALEARGVVVDSVDMRPAPTPGKVTATIIATEAGR